MFDIEGCRMMLEDGTEAQVTPLREDGPALASLVVALAVVLAFSVGHLVLG